MMKTSPPRTPPTIAPVLLELLAATTGEVLEGGASASGEEAMAPPDEDCVAPGGVLEVTESDSAGDVAVAGFLHSSISY